MLPIADTSYLPRKVARFSISDALFLFFRQVKSLLPMILLLKLQCAFYNSLGVFLLTSEASWRMKTNYNPRENVI